MDRTNEVKFRQEEGRRGGLSFRCPSTNLIAVNTGSLSVATLPPGREEVAEVRETRIPPLLPSSCLASADKRKSPAPERRASSSKTFTACG
jgi:hypothetical protein